jgi:hypothetical protein
MGCFLSIEEGTNSSKQTYPHHGTEDSGISLAKKATVPIQDGFNSNAQPRQPSPSNGNSNPNYTLNVFPEAPPKYEAIPETLQEGFKGFPAGVIRILNLLKKAAQLTFWGHKGAWGSLTARHGQIWLGSAYTLRPVTRMAILLHATILLLVGQALRSNMTFYFTTFPNLETEQLSNLDLETLKALMEVFNAKTFLQACKLIHEHETALAHEGMEDFINKSNNFLETDTPDEKLIKLLAFTREKIKGFWHGWHSTKLTFTKLQSLYKQAQKASEKQLKLLNNTSFIYQMAVSSYKRQLISRSIYPLTCTFLLGTQLEPAEVDAIQQCQLEGREAVREVRGKTKGPLWRRSTQTQPEYAAENTGSVAKELGVEGYQLRP